MKWHEICTVPSAWPSASPTSQPVRDPCAKAEQEAFCFLPEFWEQDRPFFQLTSRQAGFPCLACTSCWPRLRHLLLSSESLNWRIRLGLWSILKLCQPISIAPASRSLTGRAGMPWLLMLRVVNSGGNTLSAAWSFRTVDSDRIKIANFDAKNNFGTSQFTKRSWRFY